MARTSIVNAKAELYGLLTTPSVPTGVVVYNHEPLPGHVQKPVAATVFTAGMTSVDYLIGIRIYVTAEADAKTAQDTLDALILEIDGRMTSGWGPSGWEVTYQPDLVAFVAENVFACGREDSVAWG